MLEERFSRHRNKLLLILLVSVSLTSLMPKLSVQTVQWPPGVLFASQEELSGYVSMKSSLPVGTKVFPLCSEDSKVIGMDMACEPYVPEYEIFKRTAMNRSVGEVHGFMVSRGYQFVVIDSGCVAALGPDRTNALASEYLSSGLYEQALSNPGMMLLKAR
jgi:hypothetical protein